MISAARKILFIILLTVPVCGLLHAQQADSLSSAPAGSIVIPDTTVLPADSTRADSLFMPADSTRADSTLTALADSLSAASSQGSQVEAEVKYDASDSLVFSLDGGAVELYGDAHITYGEIDLTAAYIRYDMDQNLVTAFGMPDSSGEITGHPVFTDGDDSFESKKLRYNFKTQKGFIEEVITEQEGGFLHAEQTKKQDNGHIHLKDGKFTTCDAEHPHFYIAITKGISMPGDKIVSGPAYIVLADVPLPLGVPFGFFPNSKTKTSGILIPKYGEESRRGFYLRDGGYYFAMNDFMDLRVTGDIYTNGTWGLRVGSNYKLNYKFSGNVNVKYFKNVSGYQGIEGSYSVSRDYSIGWSHSQDNRANPTSSFRASVNLSSSSYDQNHTRNINSVMTNTKQSSISYNKSFPNSPFNLSATLTHNQNSKTEQVNLTLPKISFNMSRINPFKRKKAIGPKRWYEDIQLSYTSMLENRVSTYDSLVFTSSVFDDMRNGFQHTIPLSLSVRPFKKNPALQSFALTPSVNYKGMVYTTQTRKFIEYDNETGAGSIADTLINQISYAQSLYPSFSSGWSPKVYGLFNFTGDGRLEVIRHAMSPSVSFSYVPDMSQFQANYYREIVDENDSIWGEYSIYEGQLYGTPTVNGASGSVNFSLRNNIEAKIRKKIREGEEDENEEEGEDSDVEKVSLLDNLSLSTRYNIFHDDPETPAWSTISLNGNTRLFKNKLNLTFRAVVDPFGWDSTHTRTRKTYFAQTGKLVRLNSASMSTGFSFKSKQDSGNKNPDGKASQQESQLNDPNSVDRNPNDIYNPEHEDYYGDYVDFDIPWSLRVDYSFSYTNSLTRNSGTGYYESVTSKVVQTLRASGDFSLTPNWKIGFNTGYDLDRKEFTTTNLSIYRDLHCWEMRVSVVPFGNYKSYNFQINAKSTILQDLKYKKTRSWQDNDYWVDNF